MKLVTLSSVLSLVFLFSSCITKKNVVPIIPARVENGYIYYHTWIEEQSPFFNEYDKFFDVLKEAECTYLPTNWIIKFGAGTIRLRLETDMGVMIFALPPNEYKGKMEIQDINNNLCYILTNPDHIQWISSLKDKMVSK